MQVRPAYHYTPAANWLSDPNGLVHDGQRWHMFYQYNPQGEDWGHMSWGHAVSDDLAQWDEWSPALLDDANEMVFSGSAVIDHAGSAGFGAGAMVAAYTAALAGDPPVQAQALAYSCDGGREWTKFASNPVLDLKMADFRDPCVFWHESSAAWIMVVVKSNEQVAQIWRSGDLRQWHLASEFPAGSAPGRVWECPTLVELPVVGRPDLTRWLFKVDALHDAPGAGALCWVGAFDGFRFRPDSPVQVIDEGRDFYAAIAWNGPRDGAGRPVWIGWMGNHAYQHAFPKRGWRGVMSLPRRMSLAEHGEGLVLAQEVEPSVSALFAPPAPLATVTIPLASRLSFAPDFTGTLTLHDDMTSRCTVIATATTWQLHRDDSALPFLTATATLDRRAGEGLDLWIDSETIEALTANGTGSASFQHRPASPALRVETDQPRAVSTATLA
jgi:sucrose-6-phosphate hydrolase SacC (GH32 family)